MGILKYMRMPLNFGIRTSLRLPLVYHWTYIQRELQVCSSLAEANLKIFC